jgi:hypothetical protein
MGRFGSTLDSARVHRKQLLAYLLIKDDISRVVNELEEEADAKSQGRQENE